MGLAKGKLLLNERDRRGFATRTSFNRSSCSLDVSAYVRAVYPLMRVGPNRAAELVRLLRLFLFYYLPAAPGRSEGCTQREADGTATQYGADEDTRESCSGFHQCAAMVASKTTHSPSTFVPPLAAFTPACDTRLKSERSHTQTRSSLPNAQIFYSFLRGAGKQYGKTWSSNKICT